MTSSLFSIARENLKSRKLRSWLTILGVIISIASIVALLTISQGMNNAIEEQFAKIGSNKIFVMMKGGQPGMGEGFTNDDVELLERIQDLRYVTPYLLDPNGKVEVRKKTVYTTILGWPAKDAEKRLDDYDIGIAKGTFYGENQKYHAVITHDVAYKTDSFFKKELKVGQKILINDQKFKVSGIMERVGNPEDDSMIYIPLETAQELFNKPKKVSFIDTTVKPGKNINLVSQKIEKVLKRHRDKEDFEVMTPDQVLKIFSSILGIVQAVLIGIAAISLIVGCVGIMNSMFTNVLERTKEIGVMKSIGAQNNQIMLLFMFEAGMVGLVGGIAGIILGSLVGLGAEAAAQSAGFDLLKIELQASMLIGVLLFSIVVGVLAGFLPARRAAKLHPVDALRWIK